LWSILFCSIFSSFEQIAFGEKVWAPTGRRAAMAWQGEAALSNIRNDYPRHVAAE